MTDVQAEFIKAACDHAGVECEIRVGYSGRGMFGARTYGIVVSDAGQVSRAVATYKRTLPKPVLKTVPSLDGLKQDDMGMDVILY